MSRWTFYTAPGTCALATHIALQEAGADFDVVKLDFAAGQQQSAEYLAINPKGRVPALKTEHGVLTETPALLTFVAQRFPEAGLAPLNDPFAFAQLQELNSYLASTAHVAHAHKRRGACAHGPRGQWMPGSCSIPAAGRTRTGRSAAPARPRESAAPRTSAGRGFPSARRVRSSARARGPWG